MALPHIAFTTQASYDITRCRNVLFFQTSIPLYSPVTSWQCPYVIPHYVMHARHQEIKWKIFKLPVWKWLLHSYDNFYSVLTLGSSCLCLAFFLALQNLARWFGLRQKSQIFPLNLNFLIFSIDSLLLTSRFWVGSWSSESTPISLNQHQMNG